MVQSGTARCPASGPAGAFGHARRAKTGAEGVALPLLPGCILSSAKVYKIMRHPLLIVVNQLPVNGFFCYFAQSKMYYILLR